MNGYWTCQQGCLHPFIGDLTPNLFTELNNRLAELKMQAVFFSRPTEDQLAFSRGELLLVCSKDLKIAALVNMSKFIADFKSKTKPKSIMTTEQINKEFLELVPEVENSAVGDLNVCHFLRAMLLQTPDARCKFLLHLRTVVSRRIPNPSDLDLIDAYPLEHCEALLRTLGRWK
jgi:hypothetical protein